MWKQIDEIYAVSNEGQVKNTLSGLILAFDINSKGYYRVSINKRRYLVHRLVAIAFIPNPNSLPQVNHLDEDKTNNHATNLVWTDNRSNRNYSRALHNKTVITDEMVYYIRANKGKIRAVVMAEQLNIARITIYKILDNTLYGYLTSPPQ